MVSNANSGDIIRNYEVGGATINFEMAEILAMFTFTGQLHDDCVETFYFSKSGGNSNIVKTTTKIYVTLNNGFAPTPVVFRYTSKGGVTGS